MVGVGGGRGGDWWEGSGTDDGSGDGLLCCIWGDMAYCS